MSLHATSTLRGRKAQRVGFFTLALSAMLALWLAVSGQIAFAQADPPPPANANPRSATTAEDTTVSIDTGIQADPRYQIVIVVPGPAHGTITQGGTFPNNFTINYTPGANQTTPVSFSYQICTTVGTPTCGQSALVTVSITPVNDPPQAVTDAATVLYGQSVLIPVLSNDNGGALEFDSVSLVSVSTPAPSGTAVIENGQVRYTAPTGTCPGAPILPVTFTYQAQDGNGNQATGTVNVTVKCPGNPGLKLSEPYGYNGHTFKIDVILDSTDVNVAAVDFTLNYDQCVTEPDLPSDNQLADDVSTTLPANSFLFQAQDTDTPTPLPGAVRVIAASTTSPASILAGPGASSTRTIATLQFRALAVGNLICSPVNFTFPASGFTGTGGTPIAGVATPKTVPLDATKLNNKPTNLSLSNNKVNENSPWNTFIGKFSTTDPDAGDTFTYAFAAPYGNSAGRFWIRPLIFNNDELAVNTVGLASGIYTITVGSTDNYGGVITKTFNIEVLDVNAAPNAVDDNNGVPATGIPVAGPTNISVLANDTDSNDFPSDPACTNCSVVSVTNGSKGVVVNQGTNVRYIPTDPKFTGVDTFGYTMTDNDAPNALTDSAKVTVTVQPETLNGLPGGTVVTLGDCNKSGSVEAGDLTATGLEIFDGDGNLWYDIYKGTYKNFSPRGCNSNQDNVVDAGDISCTAKKIFNVNATCGVVVAAGAGSATLEVASGLRVAPSGSVKVPVLMRGNGNTADAAVFALTFDPAKFSFNADAADAVSLSSGTLSMVNYDAVTGRVEIVVTGMTASDGEIAAIRLTANESASGDAALSLADSSLGNDGASVAVETADGSIQIGEAAYRILIPFISK